MANSIYTNKKATSNANLTNMLLLFLCFAFFTFGCKSTNSEPKTMLVNLPVLINKTPQEVEKLIGKPKVIYPIENYNSIKIGEGMRYDLPTSDESISKAKKMGTSETTDDYILTVDYYENKSVYLYAHFPEQQAEPEDFARRCGFELKGKNPTEVFPENVKWNGNINGISFSEVILWRSPNSKDKFYACGCETKKIPRYR